MTESNQPMDAFVNQGAFDNIPLPGAVRIQASTLREKGKYAEARSCYERAVAFGEQSLGLSDPTVAVYLSDFASFLLDMSDLDQAENLYRRALRIDEEFYGPDSNRVADDLSGIAETLEAKGLYAEARAYIDRAIEIDRKTPGVHTPGVHTPGVHPPGTIKRLGILAGVCKSQGMYDEAAIHYKLALEICMKDEGCESTSVASLCSSLASLLLYQGECAKAERYGAVAVAIFKKVYGPEHPEVATALNNLASVFFVKREYKRAEPLYRRSLEIREVALGPHHPSVATALNNLGGLYNAQKNFSDADPLFQRSLKIYEKINGPNHPDTITVRAWIGDNLMKQGKCAEALPILSEVLASRERILGKDHPDVAKALHSLMQALQVQGFNRQATFNSVATQSSTWNVHDSNLQINETGSRAHDRSMKQEWMTGRILGPILQGTVCSGQWRLLEYVKWSTFYSDHTVKAILQSLKKSIPNDLDYPLVRFFADDNRTDNVVSIVAVLDFALDGKKKKRSSRKSRFIAGNEFDVNSPHLKVSHPRMYILEGHPHPAFVEWDVESETPLPRWKPILRRGGVSGCSQPSDGTPEHRQEIVEAQPQVLARDYPPASSLSILPDMMVEDEGFVQIDRVLEPDLHFSNANLDDIPLILPDTNQGALSSNYYPERVSELLNEDYEQL